MQLIQQLMSASASALTRRLCQICKVFQRKSKRTIESHPCSTKRRMYHHYPMCLESREISILVLAFLDLNHTLFKYTQYQSSQQCLSLTSSPLANDQIDTFPPKEPVAM